MATQKMHADEVETDAALVRRLLATQFPQWADLPIEPIPSGGTDHAIYRLGDDMSVRLPRIGWSGRPGGEGAALAPATGSAPAACRPGPARPRHAGRGLPWPWSSPAVARRRQRDRRLHRRPGRSSRRRRRLRHRPAANRSLARAARVGGLARRTTGEPRRRHPRGDRRSARRDRHRCGDGRVGESPRGASTGTARPSGSTATSCPGTSW